MINLRVLAIIPARGGSKGLPRKNIIDLAGKPLISWTIEASMNSKFITKTVVSTDDNEISSVSRKYGVEVVLRPGKLARDGSTSESVVKHVVDFYRLNQEEFDVIWGRIYHSYFREEITYVQCDDISLGKIEEHSY